MFSVSSTTEILLHPSFIAMTMIVSPLSPNIYLPCMLMFRDSVFLGLAFECKRGKRAEEADPTVMYQN